MTTLNKQSCPTCGQSVNEREIALFKGMVVSLFAIWQWCEQKNRHEFTRKEIKHLIQGDNQIARFGDWVMFGGLVYKKGKGNYGINVDRVRLFFAGGLEIPTIIYKDPLTSELRKTRYRTVSQIPSLRGFMDDNEQFIARYVEQPKAISWLND